MSLAEQSETPILPPTNHNGGPPIDDNPWGRDGYVKIARAMREHPLVGFGQRVSPADPEREVCYSKAEAWQDLIMECRWAPGEVVNKGRKMEIKPGQLLGAISWLAHRWNWTPKAVRWFLDQLQADQMIKRDDIYGDDASMTTKSEHGNQKGKHNGNQSGKHNGNRPKMLSICNYEIYQLALQVQRQAKGQPIGQPIGQAQRQANGNTLSKEDSNNNIYKSACAPPHVHAHAHTHAREGTPTLQHKPGSKDWLGDAELMGQLMVTAAGACLDDPVNCTGLVSVAIPLMWVNSGCDFDLDIMETLRTFSKTHKGRRINTWKYFTRPMEAARDARLQGLRKPPKAIAVSADPEVRMRHWLDNTEPGRRKVREVGRDAAASYYSDRLSGETLTPDGYTASEIDRRDAAAYEQIASEWSKSLA